MQKLVATNITVSGPQHFDGTLPQPKALHEYYRDLKVLAFPAPAEESGRSVPKAKILDLSDRMDTPQAGSNGKRRRAAGA